MTALEQRLFEAVRPSRTDRTIVIRDLVAQGADVQARGELGATALHMAVEAPYTAGDPLPSLEVVRTLLELGADVHARNDRGASPAARAVVLNDTAPVEAVDRSVAVLRLLVDHGARLEGPCGFTTGGSFAHHNCTAAPVYEFMLANGASIDLTDDRGDSPLHATVSAGRPQLVALLLQRDADVTAVNQLGQTPLGIARRLPEHTPDQRRNRAEIISLLQTAHAPAHVPSPVVTGGPVPIDMDATRRAAVEVLTGEELSWLRSNTFDSYQDLVKQVRHRYDLEGFRWLLRLCGKVLGDTGTVRALRGDQDLRVPFFHHGDLVVEGHLDVVAPVVVTGSLTVQGCLVDCGPDSLVAVGGDVTAEAMGTDGGFLVLGDIAADVVYGSYNDNTLEARTIRARLVIEDDHDVAAAVEAADHFDIDTYEQGYGEGVRERLRTLLVAEVFSEDDDGELDQEALFERLRARDPVFLADVSQ
jgi:hypothetical protein